MAGRIPAVPGGDELTPQRSAPEWLVTIFFMAGQIPAVPVLPQLFLPVFELATCE